MPRTLEKPEEEAKLSRKNAAESEGEQDFFDTELASFRALLHEDMDAALERYGFAFYFSLPEIDQVRIRKALGIPADNAIGLYNLAGAAIEDENWTEAVTLLNQALTLDPKFADAAYNLALCYEKLGQKGEAKKAWEQYLALCSDPAVKEQINAHIAELTSL